MSDPITAAIAVLDGALKDVAGTQPVFMPAQDKADALIDLTGIITRATELRMRILAVSDDVAETTGARDAGAWLAHGARLRPEDVRAEARLATALDRDRPRLATAVRDGDVNIPQAHVIDRALRNLPAQTPADTVAAAEAALVAHAADFGPRELARLGRRILDVVAPDVAEQLEATRLQDLEQHASEKTRLTIRRLGDGTTRISARIPDAAGTRLATYLHAYTNPRVSTRSQSDLLDHRASDRLPYPRRLGQAFCRLLEHVDPKRMPLHGGDATTLVVTIRYESLKRDLATADLLDDNTGDTGEGRITASQARRLACTAQILPAVLGGASQPLDLGRSRRLFTSAQRKALLVRDRTCRAEGCDIPGTWAEAHHWIPWSAGGPTDLDHGVLLCSHHHHRAHDPTYDTERLTNGDVRFHRRREGRARWSGSEKPRHSRLTSVIPMATKTGTTKARTKSYEGFSEDEKAAMKERARELKSQAKNGDLEGDLLDKIAEMPEEERVLAEAFHALARSVAPQLTCRTWYGMPAYCLDGKVLCFFQSGAKMKTRYCTIGFSDVAALDDGTLWPTSWAISTWDEGTEQELAALVRRAVGS